jgi:hypothetical protein
MPTHKTSHLFLVTLAVRHIAPTAHKLHNSNLVAATPTGTTTSLLQYENGEAWRDENDDGESEEEKRAKQQRAWNDWDEELAAKTSMKEKIDAAEHEKLGHAERQRRAQEETQIRPEEMSEFQRQKILNDRPREHDGANVQTDEPGDPDKETTSPSEHAARRQREEGLRVKDLRRT